MWFFWVLGAAILIVLWFAPNIRKDLKHKDKQDHSLYESQAYNNHNQPPSL